jgi:mannose-6-phosphate isomerase-like protein (cupin superfamily)
VDEQDCKIKKNQAVYVPPHSEQFVENTGKETLEFLCIVDPAWKKDDEAIIE